MGAIGEQIEPKKYPIDTMSIYKKNQKNLQRTVEK